MSLRASVIISFLLSVWFAAPSASAQTPTTQNAPRAHYRSGYFFYDFVIEKGDTVPLVKLMPVYCFRKKADMRKYYKLIAIVKSVYPIAKTANEKLQQMEAHMATLPNDHQRNAYAKKVEKELKEEYTPILKKMTFSQGKVLIKLIDRETSRTSYQLVKEIRGGFTAFFWQGIARIFGANLKDQYDKEGEDRAIEQIILLYEAGLI